MNMTGKSLAVALASVITLSACETNEQTGQLIGGLLGAGAGYAAAGKNNNDTVKALAVIAGAGLGAWIGGNIGRGLDQKEREKLAMSTQTVLNAPVPANSPLRAPKPAPQAAASAPSSVWTSPTNPNSVSGKSTVTQVSSTNTGGECRTVRQLVVKNGQEMSEDVKFCRQTANAAWQQMQA
ncbi:MAG TPA: hypothetical protein VG942_12990 [Hyphomonadaceae bacterium]|nr:hypothetical protein [Hyphomonadaceae bacterium]